jgi:Putative Flp pilus-assembly TadE/G-like
MRRRGDRGAATSILVIGMALLLVVMTLLLGRIARANDLRTRAQSAADAAALAAVAEIRDRGAADIVHDLIPQGEIFQDSSEQAARRYAAENDAVVDDVHPTGFFGYMVKVTLHTQACEPSPSPGQSLTHYSCAPRERGRHGTATAIAHVIFPVCELRTFDDGKRHGPRYVPPIIGVFCDGRQVHDFATARRMFAVRLVDQEENVAFDPNFAAVPPGGVANEHNRQLGRQLAAQIGWTGAQWGCLDQLWQHESGWNHLAENPSSGAYGIPQSLPADKMAVYGADYRTNPVPQIRWGLSYIAGRYGNPCNAWALWQSRSPHWY